MSEPNPSLEEILFELALAKTSASERVAFLDGVCRDNPALRVRLDVLLEGHFQAEGFLPGGPTPVELESKPVSKPDEGASTSIGRYKLLERIGEGGFGEVWMAEQKEPVKRRVALKIIKLGMDTKQIVARFEAERQALALMDHPNIARVFDAAATDTGRPYFVMELVRGTRITEYCEANQLPIEQRLTLFVQVCRAIQHAHQKGIIHRDIKPSNILVTLHDGVPVPKVIDFGIAKATQMELTEKTVFTQFHQFLGTPAYVSPEQAEMSGLDIDTRSDIYSLGVLLYELLTGTTPFDTQELLKAGLEGMRQIIREREPLRPSTRLTRVLTASQTDGSTQSKIKNQKSKISSDLDWIVMKCLEKDRARRYETANGLAHDIERHLNNEPVTARPPSHLYEFQKTVQRHWVGFTAAGAVVLVLAAGVVVSALETVRAQRAEQVQSQLRREAQSEAAKSRQVAQFLKKMLQGVEPSVAAGRDTTLLREIMDKTVINLNELTNQPEAEADLYATLGHVYFDLGNYANAEAMHRKALALREQRFGPEHLDVAGSLDGVAMALFAQDKPAEAENLERQAIALGRRLRGDERPEMAEWLNTLGMILDNEGRFTESESLAREALALRRKLLGNESPVVGESLNNLQVVVQEEGKLVEAENLAREALALRRKSLGNEHPDVAQSLDNLAGVLLKEGNLAEAESLAREGLALRRKVLNDQHPHVIFSLWTLTQVLARQGNLERALNLYNELVSNESNNFRLYGGRGEVYARLGQWKEAGDDLTRVVHANPDDCMVRHELAAALLQSDQVALYRFNCHEALGRFGQTKNPIAAERIAKDCLILPPPVADLQAAAELAYKAVRLGTNSSYLPWFQLAEGLAEYRQSHYESALGWLRQALTREGDPVTRDAQAWAILAMALDRLKQIDEARTALARSTELVRRNQPQFPHGDLGNEWNDWIFAQKFLDEATALIEGTARGAAIQNSPSNSGSEAGTQSGSNPRAGAKPAAANRRLKPE